MDSLFIHELISACILFVVGIGISLQPGAVMAGIHISHPLRGDGKRWIAFVILSIAVLLSDMILMRILEYLYNSTYSIVEYIHFLQQDMVASVILLILTVMVLDLAGVVDISHGERNLAFRYEQIKNEVMAPSWEETYVQVHAGSVWACCVSLVYMLRAPFRASWPYVVWGICCKFVVFLLNLFLVYLAAQWKGFSDILGTGMTDAIGWTNTFIFTYLIIGYLCGHLVFHYDESKLKSDITIIARLFANVVVILSIVGFILGIVVLQYYK